MKEINYNQAFSNSNYWILMMRCDLNDKAGVDIIWIMNMGIFLHYIRVTTLVTYAVKCFSLSDNIDFFADMVER